MPEVMLSVVKEKPHFPVSMRKKHLLQRNDIWMLELPEQCYFSACRHRNSSTFYLLQSVIFIIFPVLALGFVDVPVGAPAHLAALVLEQVLHPLPLAGQLHLEVIVHLRRSATPHGSRAPRPAAPRQRQQQKEEEEEEEGGAEEPCPVPDDPSALVTVDEIHEDNEDGAAAAWEEANDDEDDFLADFNRLKEELNFVTVDEVGEEDEEEESAPPGRNPKEGNRAEETAAEGAEGRTAAGAREEEEDVVGVAGPEEVEVPGGQRPHGDGAAAAGPKGLDFLLPKAGFFCHICSLFYSDESSVRNHCRTALHQQNAERFMATRKEEESGGAQQSPT